MASLKGKAKAAKSTPAPGLVIKTPTLALFIARRNSGKSYLMRHLLSVLAKGKRFEWVYIISPTAFTGEWSSVVGDRNVSDRFDPDWMNQLLAQQAKSIKADKPSPGLIILDDCLGSTSFQQEVFTKIAVAGRHYQVTIWATFQHYHRVPTVMRSNADYVFVLGAQQRKVITAMMDEYAPPEVETWQQLGKKLVEAAEDHGALLIDNSDGAASLHVVRAPADPKPYRLTYKSRGR
jgi:hypothetical protein